MHFITHNQQHIPYKVTYSKRKSVAIYIKPTELGHTVEVRAPFKTSNTTIERFVTQKAAWIAKHYTNKSITTLRNLHTQQYHIGGKLWYLGKLYKISASHHNVLVSKDTIQAPSINTHQEIIRWLTNQAQQTINSAMQQLLATAKTAQIHHNGNFTLKDLKGQWGSCSYKGKISLNMRLIHTPIAAIEYVILHELCHLKEQNHGPQFHALMDQLMPDWLLRRKMLKLSTDE